MKLIITKDYDEMSRQSANFVRKEIIKRPNLVIGLATGGTPEKTYDLLIESNKKGVSWKDVTTFNLDEYIGIPHNHKMSYHTYMNENFFNHIDININNTNIPSGEGDILNNCQEYDNSISKVGGIDLQILGIGENAHIAFNEPGSLEISKTIEVDLTDSTINANSRYFDKKEDVPKKAITMGIGSILKAKKILLLASGKNKAQAIKNTLEGPITKDVPSSFLQNHPNVTLIIDKEASSMLKK